MNRIFRIGFSFSILFSLILGTIPYTSYAARVAAEATVTQRTARQLTRKQSTAAGANEMAAELAAGVLGELPVTSPSGRAARSRRQAVTNARRGGARRDARSRASRGTPRLRSRSGTHSGSVGADEGRSPRVLTGTPAAGVREHPAVRLEGTARRRASAAAMISAAADGETKATGAAVPAMVVAGGSVLDLSVLHPGFPLERLKIGSEGMRKSNFKEVNFRGEEVTVVLETPDSVAATQEKIIKEAGATTDAAEYTALSTAISKLPNVSERPARKTLFYTNTGGHATQPIRHNRIPIQLRVLGQDTLTRFDFKGARNFLGSPKYNPQKHFIDHARLLAESFNSRGGLSPDDSVAFSEMLSAVNYDIRKLPKYPGAPSRTISASIEDLGALGKFYLDHSRFPSGLGTGAKGYQYHTGRVALHLDNEGYTLRTRGAFSDYTLKIRAADGKEPGSLEFVKSSRGGAANHVTLNPKRDTPVYLGEVEDEVLAEAHLPHMQRCLGCKKVVIPKDATTPKSWAGYYFTGADEFSKKGARNKRMPGKGKSLQEPFDEMDQLTISFAGTEVSDKGLRDRQLGYAGLQDSKYQLDRLERKSPVPSAKAASAGEDDAKAGAPAVVSMRGKSLKKKASKVPSKKASKGESVKVPKGGYDPTRHYGQHMAYILSRLDFGHLKNNIDRAHFEEIMIALRDDMYYMAVDPHKSALGSFYLDRQNWLNGKPSFPTGGKHPQHYSVQRGPVSISVSNNGYVVTAKGTKLSEKTNRLTPTEYSVHFLPKEFGEHIPGHITFSVMDDTPAPAIGRASSLPEGTSFHEQRTSRRTVSDLDGGRGGAGIGELSLGSGAVGTGARLRSRTSSGGVSPAVRYSPAASTTGGSGIMVAVDATLPGI